MAEREELHQAEHAHSACGCSGPSKSEPTGCPTITCGPCAQTLKVEKKGERRICVDFGTCEWCRTGECDKKFFLMGMPEATKANGPHCVDSDGNIGFKSLNMDQDTGKLYLTIDALDPRLNNGEVRKFVWMVQGPDMTRKSIEFNISVGK